MTEPSIALTSSRVSFVLALATVLGLAWSTITYVARQDHRITVVEHHQSDQRETTRELVAEMKALTINVARLSAVMESAMRQTQAKVDAEPRPRGVVETDSRSAPHRAPSLAPNGPNLAISGDPE
jgi:uncharacterized protein HemX